MATKKVKMLKTSADSSGAKDAGKEYEVSAEEAEALKEAGACVILEEKRETKSAGKTGGESAQSRKGEDRGNAPARKEAGRHPGGAKKTAQKKD